MRLLLPCLALLFLSTTTHAQETDFRDDLQFAEILRNRGDHDLALEFLQKLAATAPPELKKELPLEFAKTRLRIASDEPETGKRLDLYKEARDDFARFIAANPGHPRIAEANLDISRVLNLQGKTELNRALLAEDSKTKREQSAQARATLEAAAKQLQAAEKELEEQAAKLPDPDMIEEPKKKKEAQAARNRLDDEIKQTQVERALNLYDQASTYIAGGDEQASKLLVEAGKLLGKLADGPPAHPITWKARAWQGRVLHQTESADRARSKFQEVLNAASSPAAAEGVRLARYFRLLVIREQPNDADKKTGVNNILLDSAFRWRNDYRRFWQSPEGVGLAFLYAQTLLAEAATNKKLNPAIVTRYRADARSLLREVENSENEFTERARRLKIETMASQGLFKVPIDNLKLFEDCYVRAQFEAIQMMQEQKDIKDPKEAETKRKERVDNILKALERGLAMPEVKKMKASLELNTARSMLAYWALNTGKLREAIQAGETFAREDPRSSQAEMSAVYALQAYSQIIGEKQAKFEDIAAERAAMFSLATYMEERWPKGMAGDIARHSVGLQLLREENFAESIKKLSLIGPGYSSFPLVCFQIADACTKAVSAGAEPIIGDRPGDYIKRKILALESMPESALGPDPFTNQIIVSGKAMLGRDLFRYKRFQQMDDLSNTYKEKLDKLRFNDDEDKDRAIRNQLRFELVDLQLYARYGLADIAFQANDYARVVSLVDPLVDAINKSDDSQEKTNMQKNPQLGTALLLLGLRSNVQLGKIDRTDQVLDTLDRVTGEGGESSTNTLQLLAFLIRRQIDDQRKKSDKNALTQSIKGYTAILDKRVKKQKTITPEFARVLANCYSSMDEHAKAAAELAKIEAPKTAAPGGPEEALYRRIQIELAAELRQTKDPENLKKARAIIEAAMAGDGKRPGWGRRDLIALKEQGNLLIAEEKYQEAFAAFADLTKRLSRDAAKGGTIKENYLECFHHMIYSYVRLGMQKASKEERDKFLLTAAQQIVQLERSWEEFGSEASKKRFTDLLTQEAALKEQYDLVKMKK